MAAKRKVALGLMPRTGRSVAVALAGPADAPEIVAKTRLDVAFTFEQGAVFHMAQELAESQPLEAARAHVERAERKFSADARKLLAAWVDELGLKVIASALVAPAPKQLPPFEKLIKVHALLHAAEGELYRRVFAEACAEVGPKPGRVPADQLAQLAAAALELKPAVLGARLAALGKASGKPWAAEQKQATLAAWHALARSG